MTAKELIEELQKLPPDTEILRSSGCGYCEDTCQEEINSLSLEEDESQHFSEPKAKVWVLS